MPNPYHDAEGKFCSRDEMGEAIDNAIASGQVQIAMSLKNDLDEIDDQKIKAAVPETNNFYTGGHVMHNGYRYAIAEPGCSGTICMRCRYNLTIKESDAALYGDAPGCPNCKTKDTGDIFLAGVVKEHASFFDAQNVREATWFHATTSPDWHAGLLNEEEGTPLVHLGSHETAMDRANDIDANNEEEKDAVWYLHEIKLRPEADISEHVLSDDNEYAPEYADEAEGTQYSVDGVTRYVNGYECAGHISLLANVKSFEVVSTKVVKNG